MVEVKTKQKKYLGKLKKLDYSKKMGLEQGKCMTRTLTRIINLVTTVYRFLWILLRLLWLQSSRSQLKVQFSLILSSVFSCVAVTNYPQISAAWSNSSFLISVAISSLVSSNSVPQSFVLG